MKKKDKMIQIMKNTKDISNNKRKMIFSSKNSILGGLMTRRSI
jgi:hypothetical protein